MTRYTVTYELGDDGWWTATGQGGDGCHPQGRTIEEAEGRIREALALWVDDSEGAKLARDVKPR